MQRFLRDGIRVTIAALTLPDGTAEDSVVRYFYWKVRATRQL
jgi:hypothetical protein